MVGNDMTTIGEIAVVFDGPHATPKKTDSGPYFLSISSLEDGKLDLSKSAHLSEEQFIKWTKRVTPEEGDVLFSYETRLGEAALMPPNIKACLGRRMGLLRPDQNKVLPAYLLYAYLSHDFQSTIEQRKNHGCTVDRIALKELPNFPIRIPPLSEQKKIAHTLGSLDDKIELNRQMNATLESMAQALFKSWFVDFDPVIDNALAAGNSIPEEFAARAETRRKALADGTANP
ncbi:MAG: restriction endonuclease subunit S [Desulfamplus sp.]|nr:restriction endonuclease subunit S [Desulfamplus sp.]